MRHPFIARLPHSRMLFRRPLSRRSLKVAQSPGASRTAVVAGQDIGLGSAEAHPAGRISANARCDTHTGPTRNRRLARGNCRGVHLGLQITVRLALCGVSAAR